MTATSCILSIVGMAITGSLGIGITGASAQTIYVEPYVGDRPADPDLPAVARQQGAGDRNGRS